MERETRAKAKKREFVEQKAREFAQQIVKDDVENNYRDAADHRNYREAADHRDSVINTRIPREEKGNGMRGFTFVLALISFILTLLLGYAFYDMNNKMTHFAEAQNNNSVVGDLTNMQSITDKISEAVKDLQQNFAHISVDSKQNAEAIDKNATAIDEIKNRINQLIELMK